MTPAKAAEHTSGRAIISSRPRPSRARFLLLQVVIPATLALILLPSALVVATAGLDRATLETVAGWRQPYATVVMLAVTQLGSICGAAALAVASAWWLRRRGARSPLGPGLVAAVAALASELLKAVVQRPRPEVVEALVRVTSYSFPSGHAFVSTALFGAAAVAMMAQTGHRRSRVLLGCGAALLVLLVGASRVYLGVHYPSDVLAGFGLGAALLAIYSLVTAPADGHQSPLRTAGTCRSDALR